MALQVRLISSLGERTIELTPAGDGRPLVVGRAAESEIVVPTPGVSRQHCLLYVHEGQWAIHDAGSSRGTFVNGQRISEPTYLNAGDEIRLGDDAAAAKLIVGEAGVSGTQAAAPQMTALSMPEGGTAAMIPPASVPGFQAAPRSVVAGPPGLRAISGSAPGGTMDVASAPPQMPAHVLGQGEYGAEPAYSQAALPKAEHGGISAQRQGDRDSIDLAEVGERQENGPDEAQEWGQASTAARLARPRRRTGPPIGAIVIVILLLGGLVACFAVYWVHQSKPQVPVEVTSNGTPVDLSPVSGRHRHNIFETKAAPPPHAAEQIAASPTTIASGAPSGEALGAASSDTLQSATVPSTQTSAQQQALEDAKRTDKEWQRVEVAHDDFGQRTPELAIIAYEDYRAFVPNSPFAKDLQAYTDEAMDRLWWMRITAALRERASLQDDIKKIQQDISDASEQSTRDDLNKKKAAKQEELDRASNTLKAMNYTSNDEPVIGDRQQIAALRQARDPKTFEKFKEMTLKEIRRTRKILSWHAEE